MSQCCLHLNERANYRGSRCSGWHTRHIGPKIKGPGFDCRLRPINGLFFIISNLLNSDKLIDLFTFVEILVVFVDNVLN